MVFAILFSMHYIISPWIHLRFYLFIFLGTRTVD
nr:MAG TPA: hypothetical protein [Bacteriophage sp.]